MPVDTSPFYDLMETPLGTLFIGGSERGFHRFEFVEPDDPTHTLAWSLNRLAREIGTPAQHDPGAAVEAVRQFSAYFAGDRAEFDLPLAPHGTPFQREVWDELARVPPGQTRSYGQVAAAIGHPSASRAVGAANGQNPLIIVVPCHRVIGADGSLTGYGAGVERKRWLLNHEARWLPVFTQAGAA